MNLISVWKHLLNSGFNVLITQISILILLVSAWILFVSAFSLWLLLSSMFWKTEFVQNRELKRRGNYCFYLCHRNWLNLNRLIFLDQHKYQPLPDEHEWDMEMVPYTPQLVDEKVMLSKSEQFYNNMKERRSVRSFSNERVPLSVIRNIIKTASKWNTRCLVRKDVV